MKHGTTPFERAVVEAIRSLKPGEVASYGEIAEEAGFPRAARAVGAILSRADGLPWWRVVRADGSLVSPKADEQRRRLQREGIRVTNGRVRLGGPGPAPGPKPGSVRK